MMECGHFGQADTSSLAAAFSSSQAVRFSMEGAVCLTKGNSGGCERPGWSGL